MAETSRPFGASPMPNTPKTTGIKPSKIPNTPATKKLKPTPLINKRAADRSADSRRVFNPIEKVGSYLGNIGKEAKQYGRAWAHNVGASQDAKTYPPASAGLGGPTREQKAVEANKASAKATSALGQLAGAVLQGRRYDDKSGKQIKG